jgi:excisionase family DNA binding protein
MDAILRRVQEAPVEELPRLIGLCHQAAALAQFRLVAPGPLAATQAMLRPEDVAVRLGVPESKVYALLRGRQLQGIKVGKYWSVPPEAVECYIRQRAAA